MTNDARGGNKVTDASEHARIVSVVIPTYNRVNVLPRAIDSVLNQTYPYLELIVVDDASTDATTSVVEDYDDPRIEYIRHDENRGGSAARNTGIEAARGEFVSFLDDDDEWRPGKLDTQLRAYDRADPAVGVVYTGIEIVDEAGRTNTVKTLREEGDITRELLLHNFIGSFSALLVDRETVEEVGGLDESFPSWQDWEYYIRLSKVASFAAVQKPLVIRHTQGREQISDDIDAKVTESYPLLAKKFDALAAEYGGDFQRQRHGRLLFRIGYAALSHGHYALARRLLTRALIRDPTNHEACCYWLSALGGGYTYRPVRAVKRWMVRNRTSHDPPMSPPLSQPRQTSKTGR